MFTKLSTPAWWVDAQSQILRAQKLWPGVSLPQPPSTFSPSTDTEVLLLHVPGTVDDLWSGIEGPKLMSRWLYTSQSDTRLYLSPGKVEYEKPLWLGFDPEYGKGEFHMDLWGSSNLAASEVFSAMIQFPQWRHAWVRKGVSAPNLSGYALKSFDGNSLRGVPYFYMTNLHLSPRVVLDGNWSSGGDRDWSSPSVRPL